MSKPHSELRFGPSPPDEQIIAGFKAWAMRNGNPHTDWNIERRIARQLVEQYQTAEQALRAYHAIFTAWEGHKSITLNEEALRQWKSIAETALSNPASEPKEARS